MTGFDVAVVGAGMAGMATASRLQARGLSTVVLESHGQPGGCAGYLSWTLGDALRRHGLRDDRALVGLLSMLVEDTVHSTVDEAPLINAALGITIRGAGLSRCAGGMRGFWTPFTDHYRNLGGCLRVGCRVEGIAGRLGAFQIKSRRGTFLASQIVSAVPACLTRRLASELVEDRLAPYLDRDDDREGSAIVVFLGVPDAEVSDHPFTHHQILYDYDLPLGNGNNMFISVSSPCDELSAPRGYRSVMISTHCDADTWKGLEPHEYQRRKAEVGAKLVSLARRVYPRLGERAVVYETGTPRSFERFTGRPDGSVGGFRLTLRNSNQRAIPHDIGIPGLHLAGDTTWPGLGTVACVLGSRLVARQVLALESTSVGARHTSSRPTRPPNRTKTVSTWAASTVTSAESSGESSVSAET